MVAAEKLIFKFVICMPCIMQLICLFVTECGICFLKDSVDSKCLRMYVKTHLKCFSHIL